MMTSRRAAFSYVERMSYCPTASGKLHDSYYTIISYNIVVLNILKGVKACSPQIRYNCVGMHLLYL